MPNMIRSFVILTTAAVLLFQATPESTASEQTIRMAPSSLKKVLNTILSFSDKKPTAAPDPAAIEQVLDYVISGPKQLGDQLSLGMRDSMVSDYYEFTVNLPLKQLLDFVYNPDIPSHLILPSSVRRSHWIETNGKPEPPPNLGTLLADLETPIVITGREFTENTPDATSGAYYAYTLERMLILMRHQGNPVLLSLSRQPERSDVGKKGMVLGDDTEWNYLYSGEKGCTLTGLGWADSYMYNSASIMVYYQRSQPEKHVRCGVFKWIKAGWAGINLVKPQHLRKGVERFAGSFKTVLESPQLPALSDFAQGIARIETLSDAQLRSQNRFYFDALIDKHQGSAKRAYKKLIKRYFKDDAYLNSLDREALVSVVQLEYLKYMLGREHLLDANHLALLGGGNAGDAPAIQ